MKNKKKFISIIAGILVAAMVLALLVGLIPQDASAESSSELKEQLEQLESDRQEILDKMEALENEQIETNDELKKILQQKDIIDQQVALLYAEIRNVNDQIAAYNVLIADKQEELDIAEARYEELRLENLERIRAMEEEGELSYWSVLFQASSFTDLLDRINMVQEIAEADQRRLEEMAEVARVVEKARDELAAEKADLEAVRVALHQAEADLEAKGAEADLLLEDLRLIAEDQAEIYEQFEREEEAALDKIADKEKEYNDKLEEEESIAASIQASIEASIQASIEASIRDEISSRPPSGNGGPHVDPSGIRWVVPTKYSRISSKFGYRWHPITGEWKKHKGVDLAAPKGTPIYATRSGQVTASTWDDSLGNFVKINHGDGYSSLYAHMTHYVVAKGDYVKAGELIGYVGSTGSSTGPHLHFGILYYGEYVDPLDYIL